MSLNITFLGTGPAGGKVVSDNTSSSVIFEKDSVNLLVDCGKDFLEQTRKESVLDIDALILTHAHDDAINGIPQLTEFLAGKRIPVMMHPQTLEILKAKQIDLTSFKVKLFTPYISFEVGDMNVTPFLVRHTLNKETEDLFPTVGLSIDRVVYAEDVGEIPGRSMHFFENADILVLDASSWFGTQKKGHLNAKTALEFGKRFKPKKLVLTQSDETYPNFKDATLQLKKHWKRIRGNKHTEIILAKDGLRLKSNILRQKLSKEEYGIYLAPPFAEMVHSGEKSLIVRREELKVQDKLLYLIQEDNCYGIIRLKEPRKVNLKQFDKLNEFHKVSKELREQWWKNKITFFAYQFDVIKMFEEPKKVEMKKYLKNSINYVNFIETQDEHIRESLKEKTFERPTFYKKAIQVPISKKLSDNEYNFPYYLEQEYVGQYFLAECLADKTNIHTRGDDSFDMNELNDMLAKLSPHEFTVEGVVLDGQVVILDILNFKGQDLRQTPLRTRKEFLKKLIPNSEYDDKVFIENSILIESEEQLEEYLEDFKSITEEFKTNKKLILKEIDSPYVPGRNKHWVRITW